MNHLIFDTETTGFYNPKLPLNHQGQARVIQLSALMLDENLNEVKCLNTLIKPQPHYVMSEGAFNAHGISLEECRLKGREQQQVMMDFLSIRTMCDSYVCHNYAFDSSMFKVEMSHAGHLGKVTATEICTMELMTPICKLPLSRKGMFGQKYKWPKLIEALTFIGKQFVGKEHDGLSDARACAEIYRWLIANKHITLPATNSIPQVGTNPAL